MHVCSYGRGPNPQPFRQKFGQPAACRRPNSESALAHASANSIGPREIFWLQDPKAVGGGRPSAVLMLASSPTRGSHCAGRSTNMAPRSTDLRSPTKVPREPRLECPAKAALCSVTAGGGEVAAVHPKMAWHRAPLPLCRRSTGAATGAVPLGQLFVAAKRSARAQDRRFALIGRHGAQAVSQAARTRSRGG